MLIAMLMLTSLVSCAFAEAAPAASADKAPEKEEAEPKDNAPAFEPLKNGSSGEAVSLLQTKLKEMGYNIGWVDGIFGRRTEKGLKALQGAMGLEQTGVLETQEDLALVLSATKGDGVNILRGTNQGLTNYSLRDKGFNATLEEDGKGIKVTMTTQDEKGWLVLFFDDGYSRDVLAEPAGELYMISFAAKSNIDSAVINASFRKADFKENQIDFGKATIGKEWKTYSMAGKLIGTPATTQGLYLSLKENPAGTVIYIKDLKIEKGCVASDWTASPED